MYRIRQFTKALYLLSPIKNCGANIDTEPRTQFSPQKKHAHNTDRTKQSFFMQLAQLHFQFHFHLVLQVPIFLRTQETHKLQFPTPPR